MSKRKDPNMTFEFLIAAIRQVDEHMAAQAGRAINISLTLRNWLIGLYISEYELCGADRADYGERLLRDLAKQLTTQKVSNCNPVNSIAICDFTASTRRLWGRCPHN